MADEEERNPRVSVNLILRDDLSGMIKMTPAKQPETSVTVEALMEWRAQFGTPEILVSDMASYFL